MSVTENVDVVIVGGGAAGFFAAIHAARFNPSLRVVLLEKGPRFLTKVKISGGGRCNVTHACYEPDKLSKHYPRGERELMGAFFHWQPKDTWAWFEARNVELKVEEDGRVFPVTDDSATVVDCLIEAAREAGVECLTGCGVSNIAKVEEGFVVSSTCGRTWQSPRVGIMTGSLRESSLVEAIERLGHTIEPLVPSLFSFHVKDPRITDLQGVASENVEVHLPPKGRRHRGPLLITHQGFSGPAILRLSAWEARELHGCDYRFEFQISWLPDANEMRLQEEFDRQRMMAGRRLVKTYPVEGVPRRLWERLLIAAGVGPSIVWAQLSRELRQRLALELLSGRFVVDGKTLNKEEFVTCGGVNRREVNFKTMESRRVPGLYLGGECLDMDGITGGFNLQAAWTTGFLAGRSMGTAGSFSRRGEGSHGGEGDNGV